MHLGEEEPDRAPFDHDEVRAIFSAPTFAQGERPAGANARPELVVGGTARQAARSPLRSFASTAKRNKGASVSSVVKAQMVIESVASKLSSCTMTIGRDLPA
jgi:hypothetical protein